MLKKKKIMITIFSIFIMITITILSITINRKNKETNLPDIETILAGMSLEDKLLQLFITTPEALIGTYGNITKAEKQLTQTLDTYPIGGLVYFSRNIINKTQIINMTSEIQKAFTKKNQFPLFMCIDEEGGSVTRIANNPSFQVQKLPNMWDIGASKDTKAAYDAGNIIGEYLAECGFNIDFAPIADVITNDASAIGRRSFGDDATLVSEMVSAFTAGLENHKVFATLKHYPGHGAASGDTHGGISFVDKTYEELVENELLPFIHGIEEGISFIMVAHISVPNVTGDNIPSSLSGIMIQDILRDKLGYEGIVITDALDMGAIQNRYSSDEAAIMAVLAGVDILLMPADFKTAYEGLLNAVQIGMITEERIDDSIRRILKVKLSIY